MNNFQHLKWDSNFFGFNVGKLIYHDSLNLDHILNKKEQEGYQLIYLFSDKKIIIKYPLVDKKITYSLRLEKNYKSVEMQFFVEDKVSPELLELAFESGQYSRFKLDQKIPNEKFIELYTLWIENSVDKTISDDILIEEIDNRLAGMITVKVNGEIGKIGLVAVSEKYRGINIGNHLLNNCKYYLQQRGCKILEVQTQKNNIGACKFYEKNGFEVKSIDNIYHCWL